MSSGDESFYSASSMLDDSSSSLSETLGEMLQKTFIGQPQQHSINICHINAQSVPSHYSDLLDTFSNSGVHAVLISETWLKPHLPSTTYPLPGFVLIRNDRTEKRGGGVAIYLRSEFPFKILATSPANSASAEFLFLEVYVRGAKLVLGVVYCPPSVDYFSSIEPLLESLGSEYSHVIVMGDFNTDLLSHNSPRSRKLHQIISSSSLHVLPLQATHHNIDGHDTWLDLIFSSTPTLVSASGQFPAPGFSHHDLIFLSYILKPPKPRPRVLHLRSFARMDVDSLRRDASNLKWDHLYGASNIDTKVNIFCDSVRALYDIHAPVRKVKIKRPPAPWMTRGVRMMMRRRDKLFRRFRRERSEDNWRLFKAARNKCNQVIRNAKRQHILNNLSSSSPGDVWKFLGSLGIGRVRNLGPQCTLDLDDINTFFATSSKMDHQVKCRTLTHLSQLTRPNIRLFSFSSVAKDDVKKILLSIKSNAVGADGISRRMITSILDFVLSPISHIINCSLSSGLFPKQWRMAHVIPLPKVPNPSLPCHFRPISILPFLSKLLEACVHKQLYDHISRHNLLNPLQSGFRPGHSTTSALLKVTQDIRAGMEDTKATVVALVDFSNAFNTVSHDILLSILDTLMMSSEALNWFSSYLRGRRQSVRIGESSSKWCELGSGVPQGGIISPLLFSVFINLITHSLQCSYHLYADDLQLYSQANVEDMSSAIEMINEDLDRVRDWSERFGLTVNPTKCQAIIVGSQRMVGKLEKITVPPILFNGSIITLSQTVKNLGLLMDSSLSWQPQVTSVSQRVTGTLRILFRLKNLLPSKTKLMLVQTLIFPIIDYADLCYLDLNADLLNKLDRLLNNCIRFIYSLRKYDHVSAYRAQLRWLPIRERRNLRALSFLYTILTSPTPPTYLTPYFRYLCDNHGRNLRSSNNLLLLCPSHSSSSVHSSFLILAVLLWNTLPLEIRTSTNRNVFKLKVRNLFLTKLAESSQQIHHV